MDHICVLGKISWDFRRLASRPCGNRLLDLDDMENPTKLLIERHLWEINDVEVPRPTYSNLAQMSPLQNGSLTQGRHTVGI